MSGPILLWILIGVKEPADIPCQGQADPWSLSQCFNRGQLNGIDGMKVGQQVFDPLGTNARDVRQTRPFHALTTLLPVKTHGEPMRFIAQAPKQTNT